MWPKIQTCHTVVEALQTCKSCKRASGLQLSKKKSMSVWCCHTSWVIDLEKTLKACDPSTTTSNVQECH